MPSSSDVDLAEALAEVLAPALGSGVQIDGLARLAGGSSRETWRFDARVADGPSTRYVLRRDPPGAPASGVVLEAGLLAAAAEAGVPVPSLVASGDAGDGLGAAYVVVAFVDGETIPRRILRDDRLAAARDSMAVQCGEILAAIHVIPSTAVPGLARYDPLASLRDLLDSLGQPHPAFELGLRRLSATRPARSGETVVHGDFRNGNLIVDEGGVRAVLDWELAHLGDPAEDLGWLCVKSWRFGNADRIVGGFGSLDELLGA
ncbi:MAG TPA: phosphotransferase family protein, partial [Candidatus Sulfotelmatobacter sp.]|nr:phosphotransferase family protein [Candidatus Sulfotelmatobacter sp.]